jgi:protein-S-isoprenylcysteine O-methyltransferase Ste14
VQSFLIQRGFILPVTVTGVVPVVLAVSTGDWRRAVPLTLLAGALLYGWGLVLLLRTTGLFARHRGSLAPWNPPQELVVTGPYRYSRNPMITGVYAMLLGEAMALRSPFLAVWCAAFMIGMSSHIVFQEEPLLRARFGEPYDAYCKSVPRWLPRLRSYSPPES